MSTHAYLVGWIDVASGQWIDAGIYSEAAPTGFLRGPKPVTLLSAVSKFDPAVGGFDRASETLRRLAEATPALQWTTRMHTFRRQDAVKKRMQGVLLRAKRRVRSKP
jgi:hypothetical protein